MQRAAFLASLAEQRAPFDVVVIGGGANGAGIALDAASRGLKVALFERADFGSGTSSRSSKLIHGGIRYLALGHLGLVQEALHERALLLRNARGLVEPLSFLIPAASRLELLRLRAGLGLYDALAGRRRSRASRLLDRDAALACAPGLASREVIGAVTYGDAQFDDVRLLLAVLRRAAACGATLLNYAEATGFGKDARGRIRAVEVVDRHAGGGFEVGARVVINATGAASDRVRALADGDARGTVLPSQGAHVVLPRRFLGGDHALVFPHTPDGRIMFAVPWYGQWLIGTTDTALSSTSDEPRPQAGEVAMILDVAARYLSAAPHAADVMACFAGIRPLAAAPTTARSARVSREHAIDVAASGLVSVSGGKWTTYRRVAEQTVDAAVHSASLRAGVSVTRDLALGDGLDPGPAPCTAAGFPRHGLREVVSGDASLAVPLHPALPYSGAHFAWAARAEMSVSVADALAYRSRALFIDASAAAAIAPRVAAIMAAALGRDATWIEDQTRAARSAAAEFSLTPIPVRETPAPR